MSYKVIVITGASQGIGEALAYRYSNENNHLILLGRNKKKLNHVANNCLQKKVGKVQVVSIDITQSKRTIQHLKTIDQQHPIHLIIANAGTTNSLKHRNEPETWGAIEQVMHTNLMGVMASIHPVIEGMISRKQGQIALVSSLGAFRGMPITPSYCASKAGIKAYGEALRGWLRHHNIGVSVIYPGFVKSNMSNQFPARKPFMLSSDKAAIIIQKGLTKNKAVICFPFLLSLGTRLLAQLPAWIANPIMDIIGYGAKLPPPSN